MSSQSAKSQKSRPHSWSGLSLDRPSIERDINLLALFGDDPFEDAMDENSLLAMKSGRDPRCSDQPILWEFSFADSCDEDMILRFNLVRPFRFAELCLIVRSSN